MTDGNRDRGRSRTRYRSWAECVEAYRRSWPVHLLPGAQRDADRNFGQEVLAQARLQTWSRVQDAMFREGLERYRKTGQPNDIVEAITGEHGSPQKNAAVERLRARQTREMGSLALPSHRRARTRCGSRARRPRRTRVTCLSGRRRSVATRAGPDDPDPASDEPDHGVEPTPTEAVR